MEPMSITAAVTSIVYSIIKNGKQLAILYKCYENAQHSLFMIQTECAVLAAALSQVQTHFSGEGVDRKMRRIPLTVIEAFDMSLLGCSMTLSVLTDEVNRLVRDTELSQTLRSRDRSRYVWKEDMMNSLLQQLRGQSMALGLLLKAMDNASVDRILAIVESGRPYLDAVQADTASLRQSYRSKAFPPSISEMSVNETSSIYDLLKEDAFGSTTDYTDDEESNADLSLGCTTPTSQELLGEQDEQDELRGKRTEVDNGARLESRCQTLPLRSSWRHSAQDPSPVHPSLSLLQPIRQIKPPQNIRPWLLSPEKLIEGIDAIMRNRQAPAIAIAIVCPRGEQSIVRGVRKFDDPTPVTKEDQFQICRLTSVITVIVLALLIEDGFLSWETTLIELLPEFREAMDPGNCQTTIAWLTAHLSGFSTVITDAEDGSLYEYCHMIGVDCQEARMAILMSYLGKPPAQKPGHGAYDWNLANTMCIAAIMESITGTSWENLVQAKLFGPLGMHSSGFGDADVEPSRISRSRPPTRPWPHNVSGEALPPDPTPPRASDNSMTFTVSPAFRPAYGIYSTVSDLCTFARFCLNESVGLEATTTAASSSSSSSSSSPPTSSRSGLLSHRSRELIFGKAMAETSTVASLGIHSDSKWSKAEYLFHEGWVDGFAASLHIIPAKGTAIIAATNVSSDLGVDSLRDLVQLASRF